MAAMAGLVSDRSYPAHPKTRHTKMYHRIFTSWWRHDMKRFPHYWPFERGIHRLVADSLPKRVSDVSFGVIFDFSLIQILNTRWRHQMETSSALLSLCAGNSLVTGEFPPRRPATRSFDVSFDLRWINGWANNREAGGLRRHRTHYDVIVISCQGDKPHWIKYHVEWSR